jgi:hypothetical protein
MFFLVEFSYSLNEAVEKRDLGTIDIAPVFSQHRFLIVVLVTYSATMLLSVHTFVAFQCCVPCNTVAIGR